MHINDNYINYLQDMIDFSPEFKDIVVSALPMKINQSLKRMKACA